MKLKSTLVKDINKVVKRGADLIDNCLYKKIVGS